MAARYVPPAIARIRFRAIFAVCWVTAFIACVVATFARFEVIDPLFRTMVLVIGTAIAALFGIYLFSHILRPVLRLNEELAAEARTAEAEELTAGAATMAVAVSRLRDRDLVAPKKEAPPEPPPRWERCRRFSPAVALAEDPRLALTRAGAAAAVLGLARQATGAAAGAFLLPGSGPARAYYAVAAAESLAGEWGDWHPDDAAREWLRSAEAPIPVADPAAAPGKLIPEPEPNWLVLPAWFRGELAGVLVLRLGDRPAPDADRRQLLRDLATEAAAVLALADAYEQVRAGYRASVRALAGIWEVRGGFPAGYAESVAKSAAALGKAAGLAAPEREATELAAWLHDLGGLGLSECLRRAEGGLAAAELQALERHPFLAVELVKALELRREVTPILLGHHERWDGTGYPEKVAGERIPAGARVLAAAIAWQRARQAAPDDPEAALAAVRKQAGHQLDPGLVDRLVKLARSGGV